MKKTLLMLGLVSSSFILHAQLNVGQKAEDKAGQVIDDLLFGKKKKKTASTDTESESYPTASDNSSKSNNDPLGGYVPSDVDYDNLSDGAVVPFRDLINFLPNKVGGYILSQKPEGSTVKYGDMNYSFAQKTLTNGDETLNVGIFDYLTAGALLTPYTQQYEYESTDGVLKSVTVQDQPGWYSSNYSSDESTLVLVVKNRFYVTYSGTNISKEKMSDWASELNLKRLPSGKPVSEE